MQADQRDKQDERDAPADDGVTRLIIGCAFEVANTLGIGFAEKVYQNALAHECRWRGLSIVQQKGIIVRYKDIVVGEYAADLLVQNRILVELKVVKALTDLHAAQCQNYVCATGMPVCLLINFGRPRIEIRRVQAIA